MIPRYLLSLDVIIEPFEREDTGAGSLFPLNTVNTRLFAIPSGGRRKNEGERSSPPGDERKIPITYPGEIDLLAIPLVEKGAVALKHEQVAMELVLIDSHDTVGVPRKIDRVKFKPVIPASTRCIDFVTSIGQYNYKLTCNL